MAKFTPNMVHQINRVPKPFKGLVVDMLEHKDFLEFRVYENQVMALDLERRATIMEYLLKIQQIVELYGVQCILNGSVGDPPK